MHSLTTSVLLGLGFAAATGATTVPLSKRGECVALAAEWTITNFAFHSGDGEQITHFNFTDSLDRSTYCTSTFREVSTNGVGPAAFHKCDNPALRFKYVRPNVTLEETVSCSPKDGTQFATTDVPLECEVFGATLNCGSQEKQIHLFPTLEFK